MLHGCKTECLGASYSKCGSFAEEQCRVAEIESIEEKIGADGRRRCRILVRGTDELLVTRMTDLASHPLSRR
eukprot:6186161-Amphidinium_carterae.1